MARRRRYKPIVRLRRALLLAIILFTGAMIGYYYSGRLSGGGGPDGDMEADDDSFRVGEGVMTVARGFDYEVTDGEELAYRVRADKLVSDVQDRMELDQVEIDLPQEGGGVVQIVSDHGIIHLDSKSATLDGDVRARSAEGMELRGESFEVLRDGRQLISHSPVTFSRENEYTGSAKALHYTIKKERLILDGDVVIRGLPEDDPEAGSLRCQKLTYDRLEGTLRLEGDVRVERGFEFLEGGRVSLTFGEGESDIRFVRAESGVSGRYLPEPGAGDAGARVDFQGKLLYVSFEAGGRQAREAELHGRVRREAALDMVDETGLSRLVTASLVRARFKNGEVTRVDASEPVVVVERHSFAPAHPIRRICSESAQLDFDTLGEIETVTLAGNVDYQAPDAQALGDRIVARSAGGAVAVTGDPAIVVGDRGDLRAPRIVYSEAGSVVATGGVRAELRQEGGYKLMAGESKEPVRVTAREARWSEQTESFTFTGSVRAWQGRDYLLAETMVGEPALDRLTATTRVKSVLRRNSEARPAAEGSEAGSEPIEITAEKLIYEQARRVVTYEGDARAVQANRILKCEKLDVELDDADEVDRLVCTGDLLVEDPAQGKEVRGERAVYVPGDDEVDVTGAPVVLTDRDGTELRGGRIVYRFDTGAAKIHSRPLATAAATGDAG